ncbi:MAG: prenyltransferase [Thermodesulfobacteriota bacterium]|nr:prenyltransferase [Thermodesulfobacteriota bacterium]
MEVNSKRSIQIPARDTRSRGKTIKGWIQLSRPPFHLVGLLPFVLGALLAWYIYGVFNWTVFVWSTAAVLLIMLSTYYSGEYHDLKEDKLSAEIERNVFSGGSQAIVKNLMSHKQAKIAGYVTLVLAGIIGLILHFYYKTGFWTIPLGVIGMTAGFFYSTPPLRWVKRGVGEIIIGFCYGWLPVATAFYLQTGTIDNIVHWISIPIACTIFNVILINEFPDYPADMSEGKRNLAVRLGKDTAAFLYIAMTVIAWIAFGLAVSQGLPAVGLLFYLPVFLIALWLVFLISKKDYLNKKRLELICGLTIVVNLGTALAYILALWLGGF